jgi:hypothetical protein
MTRVFWKDEDEVDGEAIGPVLVVTAEPDASLGRPFQPNCVCGDYAARRLRSTETNEWGYPLCPDCGAEVPPPWVTEADALAIAAAHGVELEAS